MSNFVHVPIDKKQLFQIQEYQYKGPDFPYHFHPEIEITYVCNSSGLRIIGDHIESYGPDDLVVIGSNIPHQWQKDAQYGSKGSKYEHIYVIHINVELIEQLTHKLMELYRLRSFLESCQRVLKYDAKVALKAKEIIQKLHQASDTFAITGLLELLDFLQNSPYKVLLNSEEPVRMQSESDAKIFKIISRIHEQYQKELSAQELAREFSMSVSSFSHYFKRKTAKTYSTYLTEIRLGHVCKRLRSTEDTIAEIAFDCGFQNLSNFNRLFKNTLGRTPNHYRKLFSEIKA